VLMVLAGGGYWLLSRLNRAWRFWPSLAELAVRAERLYPQLAGSLASAVEFSLDPADYAHPTSTAAMTRAAINEVQDKSQGVDLRRMIKLKPTLQAGTMALLALTVLASIVIASPQASATAARRWVMPLGQTQWPKVNQIEALTQDGAVFAADGKVRLRAKVTQGWSEGMRMTMQYRVLDQAGEGQWVSVRVAEQRSENAGEHLYETMLDVPPAVARSLMSGQRTSAGLEVRYAAGDALTDTQTLTLAARPEVVSVVVTTSPPAYALGLIGEQQSPLHEQAERIASTSAYRGSTVRMQVRFNKPIPKAQATAAAQTWLKAIGENAVLSLAGSGDTADGLTLDWTLDHTILGSIILTDGFGLTSTGSDKQFRIQAVDDELPSVVLLRPVIDESVLPAASVDLKGTAQDDVAMRSLWLDIVVPDRTKTPADADTIATRSLDDSGLITTGRYESLELDYLLKLAPLNLLPGDEVLITAYGKDVFELDGKQHEPVASETRRLRVITEQELADQVRRVLRGVRQTAQSLERNQRLVAGKTQDAAPTETAEQQGSIGRRIEAQEETLSAVRERLDRNQPHNLTGLEQLLDRADELLDNAKKASDQAEQNLQDAATNKASAEQAKQQAREALDAGNKPLSEKLGDQADQAQQQQKQNQGEAAGAQEKAREQLAELVAALDMGESVGEIESELAAIRSDAERVAQDTRELLPRTIGQKPEDLPKDLREKLEDNAGKQGKLAERAEELIDKMRSTADEIGENGETPEQRATAKTLSEAADIAQRQGLKENAEQAAQQLEQNQVADASTKQQQAMSTLEQMLAELGKQQQRRQEELKRLLQELAEKIQKLVDEQGDQLARAQAAAQDAVALLEQPQFALRRRTMLVEAQAMESPKTEEAGQELGSAVQTQAEAVKAARLSDKPATIAQETLALEHLEKALALVNQQQQEEQQEQRREERFALRQAYYDLADKQEALGLILTQHERAEAYSRRDWAQISKLHKEALEGATFEERERSIRETSTQLQEKAGEAMVYQSLHRRIDQAAGRAERRLSDWTIDRLVLDDGASVARLLRAMGDALDDSADPDKFEKDDEGGDQEGGEGGGGGAEPPLVPDIAQIKLLREVMIVLRNQTESVDAAGDTLSPQARQDRLNDLAAQQNELKTLGEQLIEKLRQQMQPRPIEPRE